MNLFAENRIFLNQSFASSDELFDFVGKQMEGLGMAKAGFGDSLKRRESSYPTGLPGLTADIALPHTDPEFTEALRAIVDNFLVNDEGKLTGRFLKLDASKDCMEILCKIQKEI